MEYGVLGKTGLEVSRVGLGTGGDSRLGQKLGMTESQACQIIYRALDLGINFFDTSPAYGDTEAILGRALKNAKSTTPYYICTKIPINNEGMILKDPEKIVHSVERSLKRLRTERLDIALFHGLKPGDYNEAIDRLYPTLTRLRDKGMIRYLGVSEHMWGDLDQTTVSQAVETDLFDVFMIRYNMFIQGPEWRVFPKLSQSNPGLLCMSPVRKPFLNPNELIKWINNCKSEGKLDSEALSENDPVLNWIKGGTVVLVDNGIKFVAHQKEIHVLVTGTSNLEHLEANVRSALSPPLPETTEATLRRIYGKRETSRSA